MYNDAWRNRCLPPDRRSRAGLPSRDRGRRAQGTGDRSAAVAEVRFVDAGRPEERHNESPPPIVGGLKAGRGTKNFRTTPDCPIGLLYLVFHRQDERSLGD